MIQDTFKQVNQWLLTSLVALTPYCCMANSYENLTSIHQLTKETLERRVKPNFRPPQEELRYRLVNAFEKLVIDFHDASLVFLWGSDVTVPEYMRLVLDDIQGVSALLSGRDAASAEQVATILTNYYLSAGLDYLNGVETICDIPNNHNELISRWRQVGGFLADLVIANRALTGQQAQAVRNLFFNWTNSQILYISSAFRQCPDFTAPVSASASNEAYAQARLLTVQVSNTIYEALSQ